MEKYSITIILFQRYLYAPVSCH